MLDLARRLVKLGIENSERWTATFKHDWGRGFGLHRGTGDSKSRSGAAVETSATRMDTTVVLDLRNGQDGCARATMILAALERPGRRTVRLLVRLAFLIVGLGLAAKALARDPLFAEVREEPISVQLHLHGPFSEGMGSIEAHSFEASELGVDVLWWSDHDFRILSFEHVTRFGFEDWERPLDDGEAWGARSRRRSPGDKYVRVVEPNDRSSAELASTPVNEGKKSLRVTTRSESEEFEPFPVVFNTDLWLHRRSLASRPTVRLAVHPEEVGPDARAFLHVGISEHAPHDDLPISQYGVRYVLDSGPSPGAVTEPRRIGAVCYVHVRVEPGRWNELELHPYEDVRACFPFFLAGDNALHDLRFGVEARRGARAEVCFDDLRIDNGVLPRRMFEQQRQLIDRVAKGFPGLRQLQGVEISLTPTHLNEFSVDTQLMDYERILADRPRHRREELLSEGGLLRRAVQKAHAGGGLISYNHLFGTGGPGTTPNLTREETLEVLLEIEADGADLLEVGYRDRGGGSLADHLWVWDQLALKGLRLVGTGVSDSHGGPGGRWRDATNNFVSWIWSTAPEKPELIEAMRRGRLFFGDIVHFDGELDLVTREGWRMGEEVFTDRGEVTLEVSLSGIRAPGRVVFVQDGETLGSRPVEPGDVVLEERIELAGTADGFVRVELHDADGNPVVLSNPIYFLRQPVDKGARACVTRIDVGGIVSLHVQRFRVVSVDASQGELVLRGIGRDGRLGLDCSAFGEDFQVELNDLAGGFTREGAILRFTGLEGTGAIRITR